MDSMTTCKHNDGKHTFEYTGEFHVVTNNPDWKGFVLSLKHKCATCHAEEWEDVKLTGQEYLWYNSAGQLIKEEGAGAMSEYISMIQTGAALPKDVQLTRERFVEILSLAHRHYMLKLLTITRQ